MNKKSLIVVTQTPKGLDGILKVSTDYIKKNYSAVVNVSDSSCATFDYQKEGIPSFWFPINEIGNWNYYPFFGTLKVINEYYDGRPILLHCHAGANRSPSIAYAILLIKDYTSDEIEKNLNYENLPLVFNRNIQRGHIPNRILEFLKIADREPSLSLYFVLRRLDAAYEEWSQKKFAGQNDCVVSADSEKGTRLVYSKERKRFVVFKDGVEGEPDGSIVTMTPWIEPVYKNQEWNVTPLVPETKI